jgi:hypothetical protein
MHSAELSSNIEQGLEWYKNLIRTVFMKDKGVRFYVGFQGEELLAVLPIKITSGRWGKSIEVLGNVFTSLYHPSLSPHCSEEQLAMLLRRLISDNPTVSLIRFSPMDPDSHYFRALSSAIRYNGLAGFSYVFFENRYFKVQDGWLGYFVSQSGQLRNIPKRKLENFESVGGALELITCKERLDYAIQTYRDLCTKSCNNPELYPEFFSGLMRMLARKGWLRFGIASINGRPIASQLWIVAYGKASIFKPVYDRKYSCYSAGALLTSYLMQYVLDEDGVKEVDYLKGDDPYTTLWLSDRRNRWGVVAFNLRSFGGLLGWGREILGLLLQGGNGIVN